MKAIPLETHNPKVHLIEPVLERDAQLSLQWLHGDIGKNTLRLMGIPNEDNNPTTLKAEEQRVAKFITDPKQWNWMIEYDGKVVGSIWVDLAPKDSVPSPAIHLMIGDPSARGKGIGFSSTSKVIDHLKEQGNKSVYSRHLTKNSGAKSLLDTLGFQDKEEPYPDGSLEWQNVVKHIDK